MDENIEFRRVWQLLQAKAAENEIAPGLERISRVLELMGNPQNAYKSIHIAGTNGKTSTARMIEAIAIEAGLNTGRITSPHLHSPVERISLNGQNISQADFIQAYLDVEPFVAVVDQESRDNAGPLMTMFEVLTAMQFQAFATAAIDLAIVEVGLGGRFDATNVINPEVSVITQIDLDHQEYLGETIAQIASEKAGILKPQSIAVIAAQTHPEALAVIKERATELQIQAAIENEQIALTNRIPAVGGQMISLQGISEKYQEIFLPLFGEHQAHNALMAVAAFEAFITGGETPLEPELLQNAFSEVTSPGRAELVRQSPVILVDAAHNPAGANALVETIRENFDFTYTVGIVGILQEKNAEYILEILEPIFDEVVITQSSSPRAIASDKLAILAEDIFGSKERVIEVMHLPDAIQIAVDRAEAGHEAGAVVATGSVTIAAEVRQLLGANRNES